jgi:hypothetical protein
MHMSEYGQDHKAGRKELAPSIGFVFAAYTLLCSLEQVKT